MKIIIIGDVHIGSSEHIGFFDPNTQMNSRLVDYSNTFDKIIEYIELNHIDAVVLCGDYYKTRRPTSLHRKIFDSKIRALSDLGVLVFMVLGNHDIIADNNTTVLDSLRIARYPNVRIYDAVGSVNIGLMHKDNINLIFVPFMNKNSFNVETNEEAIHCLREKIQSNLNALDMSVPTILIGHYLIDGVKLGTLTISKDNAPNELVLPHDMFKGINLTIMGHVHNRQKVSDKPHILYVGSMERTNIGEGDDQKGIFELDTEKMSVNFINMNVRNIFNIALIGPEYLDQLRAYDLRDAIVRVDIHMNEEQVYQIDLDEVQRILKEKKVHFYLPPNIVPIKKEVEIFNVENMSDRELFVEYINANFEKPDELLKLGLEIMENET